MLAFRRMREAALLRDRNKVAELMNLHCATLRCERRFVEVPVLFERLARVQRSSTVMSRAGENVSV